MTDAQHQQQPTAAPAVITVPPPAQTADKSSPSSKTKRVPAPPKRAAGTKVVSRSKRAGLSMPVGRIARLMKDMHPAERLSGTAPVAMAAGLEAIAATVLAKAGEKVVEKKKCRIKPKYISMAAAVDRDLHDLLKDSILSTVEIAPENKVAKETIDTAAKKSRDAAKREKKKKAKMATAQSQDEKMKEIKRLAANAKRRQKAKEKRADEKKKKPADGDEDETEKPKDSKDDEKAAPTRKRKREANEKQDDEGEKAAKPAKETKKPKKKAVPKEPPAKKAKVAAAAPPPPPPASKKKVTTMPSATVPAVAPEMENDFSDGSDASSEDDDE